MFGNNWDEAEATIVAARPTYTGDGSSPHYEFVADVHRPGTPTFRTTLKPPTIATDFWRPDVGDVVSVLVKSGGWGTANGKVKFDQRDPRISVRAYEAGRRQAFEAAAQHQSAQHQSARHQPARHQAADTHQAGTTRGGTDLPADLVELMTAEVPTDPAARLSRLQNLRDQGLMTDEEYSAQRRRIFDDI